MKIKRNENTDHTIKELQQIRLLSKKLLEKLSTYRGDQLPKEFITKINHELKTPLTPLRAYTDMLLSGHYGPLSNKQYEKITLINSDLKQLEKTIENLVTNLSSTKLGQDSKDSSLNSHKLKELEQEKKLLQSINQMLVKQSEKIIKSKSGLEKKLSRAEHDIKELQQSENILKKSITMEEQKNLNLSKKHIMTIAGAVVVIGLITTAYSLYVVDLVGQEYRVEDLGALKSSYVIQNLKGDRVDTWLSWRLTQGATLYVNILNAQQHPEKAETVKDVILSKEYYEIDDHLLGKAPKGTITKYYLGWAGALEVASQTPTKFPVPANIQVTESATGAGDITITLANTRSGDGYAGITKSIADESQNQILKSDITIYDVENLSENQLMAIVRHELGHAFGLAHSTATEDLMHPELVSEYPYISHCDITAIVELYDGSQKSEVVCEK